MEQPVSRIICTESENYVAIVWNSDSVLGRWQVELSVEETPLVEIQRVLQINLFHVLVGGTADTNHVEGVAVQVEWMRQVRLLYFVYKNHLDDSVVGDIHLMSAHAVGAAVSWPVVPVTELFRRDVVDLRKRRRRRKRERDFIDERNYVISGRRDQESIIRLRLEDLFWPVEEETEWQEYFHIWALLENSFVDLAGILQLAHTNRVLSWTAAHGVQGIQYNTLRKSEIVSRSVGARLVRATGVAQYGQLLSTWDTTFAKSANLNPVRFSRLIGVYNKVVPFTRERDDGLHADRMHRLAVGGDHGEHVPLERNLRWTNRAEGIDQPETITTPGCYGENLQGCVRHEAGVRIPKLSFSVDKHAFRCLSSVNGETARETFGRILVEPIAK